MDKECNTIRLYSPQALPVYEVLCRDGVCYSKAEYVKKKYQESAPIFLTAYRWFVSEASKIVPRPEGAEFPYWAFADERMCDIGENSRLLILDVPKDEVVLFDMFDWNRVLQLTLLGENEEQESKFRDKLRASGMNENDIMLTGFYPMQKREIQNSWKRLFRHQEALKTGDTQVVRSVQAGLWQIKEEWVADVR